MLTRHTLSSPNGNGSSLSVQVALTNRFGGVSTAPYTGLNLGCGSGDDPGAVDENRSRVAHTLGLGRGSVAWMWQHHGAAVAHVRQPPGKLAHADTPYVDALVTAVPGVALAVLVADCVPVLVADPVRGVAGAAHAGRAGMAGGIVPALLARTGKLGAQPERMVAMLGPAICGSCYEVPHHLRAQAAREVPSASCVTWQGTPGLDVRAGVAEQLGRAGVAQVFRDARCTRESLEMYSYRREGRTGRCAGYIWLDAGSGR